MSDLAGRTAVVTGTAHGIGVALYEQFAYSDDGQPLTTSFMDYLLPGIHEVPEISDGEHCTPSPFTTLGQKGAGEAGYMGAPAAVAGAVNDALAGRAACVLDLRGVTHPTVDSQVVRL